MRMNPTRVLALVAGLACAANAATINVPADFPTIQAAIDAAVDGDEILVAPGTYAELIDYQGKTLRVQATGGSAVTTIDGTGFADSTVTIIGSGVDTVLADFTIIGSSGKPDPADPLITQGGGLFLQDSPATISGCIFRDGSVSDDGGGAIVIDSDATFLACLFENNTADNDFDVNGDGGGLAINGIVGTPTVTVSNCTFTNNSSSDDGGGISVIGANAEIILGTFTGNSADDNGGGAFFLGAGGSIFNSTFDQNVADEGAGVHLNTDGTPTMSGLSFTNNTAIGGGPNGGALYVLATTASISGSEFINNSSDGTGGAIFVGVTAAGNAGILDVDNCTFDGNNAGTDGGAIDVAGDPGFVTVTNSTFTGNSANDDGGDLRFINGGTGLVDNCTFTDSVPPHAGGSIYNFSGPNPTIRNSTFTNSSGGRGGAIGMLLSAADDAEPAEMTFENVTITGGDAFDFGGAIYQGAGTVVTGTNVTISDSAAGLIGPAMELRGGAATYTNLLLTGSSSFAGFGASAIELSGGTAFVGDLTLINSTIANNTNDGADGAIVSINPTDVLTMVNTIVRGNDGAVQIDVPNTNVTYSNIEGGFAGTGNIDADPLFTDPFGGDYTLGAGSPSIDAGDSSAVPAGVTTDLAGDSRFSDDPGTVDTGVGPGPVVDMGAFEVQGGNAGCNPADLSSPTDPGVPDGILTGADFFEFLDFFSQGC